MLHNKKNGFAHPFVLLIAILGVAFALGIVVYNSSDFGTKIIGSTIEEEMMLDGDVAGSATLSNPIVALDDTACTGLCAMKFEGPEGTGTEPVADTDGDWFADSFDVCPSRSAGNNPDPAMIGCPMEVTVDRDGDGIRDDLDICPDTAVGSNADPNRRGCSMVSGDPAGDSVTQNGSFKMQKTSPSEVARYWKFRPASAGTVKTSIVTAKQTDLAEADALRLDFIKAPLSGTNSIVQENVDMNPVTRYEITFTANASAGGNAGFAIRDMGYITTLLAPSASFKLRPGWFAYKAVITTKNYSANKAASVRLGINMPEGSNIVIDNVFVRPLQ